MEYYMSKLYRPSNGTEGEIFESKFCGRCKHDKFHEDESQGCDILLRALLFDKEDEGYPTEWTYDENDLPTCTAFELNDTD
jgi:hypothetical protein